MSYPTTGPLVVTEHTNRDTGERYAELRANFSVLGDLDVHGEITQNGNPLESAGAALPYTTYVALLTQSGTDAPVATVLENTLGGTVVWTRVSTGQYQATLAGAFAQSKTAVFLTGYAPVTEESRFMGASVDSSGDMVLITTQRILASFSEQVLDDGYLTNTPIEIRVYP